MPRTPLAIPAQPRRLALILLACIPASLAAQTPALSQPEIVQVHGIVVNAVTHAPIPHALVVSSDQHMALLADEEGRFTFAVKPPQPDTNQDPRGFSGLGPTVFLMARRPGFRPMNQPTALRLDDPQTLAATLQLKLMPESTVTGRIAAPGIDAPQGVSVQLIHRQVHDGTATWQPGQTTQTNLHGEYRFANLIPGDYRLLTQEWMERTGPTTPVPGKPEIGYPPVAYPQAPGAAAAIHITGGETIHADLTLHPEPYHAVSFPIANYGTPQGVTVSVRNQAGLPFSLGPNPRAQTVEGTLPDGLYHLAVVASGQPSEPNTMPPTTYAEVEFAVAGKPLRGPSLTLAPGASIPVNVRQEFTAPDPNQQLANPQQGPAAGPISSLDATTERGQRFMRQMQMRSVDVSLQPKDADGTIAQLANPKPDSSGPESLFLQNVLPGTYRVFVNPHRGYAASVTADGVDLLRQPLVIAPGGATPTIEIVLRDNTGTITGTVADPAVPRPRKPGFFNIWALPYGSDTPAGNIMQGFAAPEGTFTIPNLPPGTYLLLATAASPLQLEYRNEDVTKAYASKGAVVTLGPGQTANVTLKPALFEDQTGVQSAEGED